MKFNLNINGEDREVEAELDTPLLWVLRDGLQLTGTKFGCGIAQCGACTVHIDGKTARSCVMPVQELQGKKIETIEGISGPVAKAVQTSWQDLQVPQCGYCQSGQIMTAVVLLREISEPSDEDIDAAMTANACRCATYVRIRKAIHDAASNIDG
ncbi:MAG: (2Fe-2S)-binding protein [Myxococcota bacterium]